MVVLLNLSSIDYPPVRLYGHIDCSAVFIDVVGVLLCLVKMGCSIFLKWADCIRHEIKYRNNIIQKFVIHT